MLNFIFVEGLAGDSLYWKCKDTGSTVKDATTSAADIKAGKEEMDAACGGSASKVRWVTTDRAATNKGSWNEAEEAGMKGGGWWSVRRCKSARSLRLYLE